MLRRDVSPSVGDLIYGDRMTCCEKIIAAAETRTPCECAASGFCPLHKFTTTQREWELCRTRNDYFALWASGSSPQHDRERATSGEPPLWYPRFGNWTAKAIRVATFGLIVPCTGCKGRMAALNRFGKRLADWVRGTL